MNPYINIHFKKSLCLILAGLAVSGPLLATSFEYRVHAKGVVGSPGVPTLVFFDENGVALSGALAFPNTKVGATSQAGLQVKNSGAIPIKLLGSPSVTGAGMSVDAGCSNKTLSKDGVCNVILSFAPSGIALSEGSLSLLTNAANTPTKTIGLAGSGYVPALAVAPSSGSFGTVEAGGTRDIPLTLTGGSGGPVTLSQVSLTGANFSVLSSTCAEVLQASQTCTVTIRATVPANSPNGTGLSGQLAVSSDASTPTITVPLTGSVSAPFSQIVGPLAMPYYNQSVNASGVPVPFTVSGWINPTTVGSNGYIFSLGNYRNAQDNTMRRAGIISQGGRLGYGWNYAVSPVRWNDGVDIGALPLNTWTHIAAEVDASYKLRVAVNGKFVFTKQLNSSVSVPMNGNVPEAGGEVGVGDANTVAFATPKLTGTVQQVQIWKELHWKGLDFTPPTRN